MVAKKRKQIATKQSIEDPKFFAKFEKFSGLETKVPEGLYKIRKSLFDYRMDWHREHQTGWYHQRVFVFIKNASKELPDYLEIPTEEQEIQREIDDDVFGSEETSEIEIPKINVNPIQAAIEYHLKRIIAECENANFTVERICGLVLCMGDYCLMIVESPELQIAEFFAKIGESFGEFWAKNRVFMIDDHISKYLFDEFTIRRAPAIFINEKFTPNTENDEYLMAKEHRSIASKLRRICQCLHKESKEETGDEEEKEPETEEEEGNEDDCAQIYSEGFKKLIPEVQRIELVLNSKRFYSTMDHQVSLQRDIPISPEEDEIYWPIMNNYTPSGIYIKTKFDYNLTYPESNEAVEEGGQKGVADEPAELDDSDEEVEGEAEVGTSEAASAGN